MDKVMREMFGEEPTNSFVIVEGTCECGYTTRNPYGSVAEFYEKLLASSGNVYFTCGKCKQKFVLD